MNLLSERDLIWSPIVVNSKMNRSRSSSGVNSYEKEFKFKPEDFLESKIRKSGNSSWLDLCCGEGIALQQTASYFSNQKMADKITLKGVDLIDSFKSSKLQNNIVDFEVASVVSWLPAGKYDLITCSHGLHYIGDKLKVIQTVLKALKPDGLFIANLDLKNILITKGNVSIKDFFDKNKLEYNSRSKILKRIGPVDLKLKFTYQGANDKAGPNYTGQESVTSYYTLNE